jgi:hypothetical protein
LDLARSSSERPIATVARLAALGIRAGVHLIFRRDPALATPDEELGHAVVDGGRGEHHGSACTVERRSLRKPVKARGHLDRSKLVEGSTSAEASWRRHRGCYYYR